MKNINAVQRYFKVYQLWYSLKQRCSELKKLKPWSALNSVVSERISADLLNHWAMIFTHGYQIMITLAEVMKTLEEVIKMALLVFKKCNLCQFSAKWQQKLKFFEIFCKFHPTKLEMLLKIWIISVLLLEQYQKTKSSSFCHMFGLRKDWINFLLFPFYRICAENPTRCRYWGTLTYSTKIEKFNRKIQFWIRERWPEILIDVQWFSDVFSDAKKFSKVLMMLSNLQ